MKGQPPVIAKAKSTNGTRLVLAILPLSLLLGHRRQTISQEADIAKLVQCFTCVNKPKLFRNSMSKWAYPLYALSTLGKHFFFVLIVGMCKALH